MIKKVRIYEFEELEEKAKEKARADQREFCLHFDWWDYVYDWAREAGGMMGINIKDIYFSGFYSQGDGACFVGDYEYKKGWKKSIVSNYRDEELVKIGESLQAIQKNYFYKINATITSNFYSRYSHEKSVNIDCYVDDETHLRPEDDEDIQECLRNFMRWIYSKLENEYVYLNSDESIDEHIIMNGYLYNKGGSIFTGEIVEEREEEQ